MSFGKAFHTRKEAAVHLKRVKDGLERRDAFVTDDFTIRKMSKKIHPRRKKLFHVGTFLDFLNYQRTPRRWHCNRLNHTSLGIISFITYLL